MEVFYFFFRTKIAEEISLLLCVVFKSYERYRYKKLNQILKEKKRLKNNSAILMYDYVGKYMYNEHIVKVVVKLTKLKSTLWCVSMWREMRMKFYE